MRATRTWQQLAAAYAERRASAAAAHRLLLAAETMDEAAVFTIDAWCQRMLREHAFDSGSLFDEELVSDERALFEDAAHDYWRQHVYPLDARGAGARAAAAGATSSALEARVRELVPRAEPARHGGQRTAGGADRARRSARSRPSWRA